MVCTMLDLVYNWLFILLSYSNSKNATVLLKRMNMLPSGLYLFYMS